MNRKTMLERALQKNMQRLVHLLLIQIQKLQGLQHSLLVFGGLVEQVGVQMEQRVTFLVVEVLAEVGYQEALH